MARFRDEEGNMSAGGFSAGRESARPTDFSVSATEKSLVFGCSDRPSGISVMPDAEEARSWFAGGGGA